MWLSGPAADSHMEDRGEDGKISLRFVTTNRGKVDFLRVVLESAAADSILQSVVPRSASPPTPFPLNH